MLRVTMEHGKHSLIYKLEGDLSGEWVEALRDTWINTPVSAKRDDEIVDLNGVIRIDPSGLHLLAVMNMAGVQFVARAPYTKSLLSGFSGRVRDEVP